MPAAGFAFMGISAYAWVNGRQRNELEGGFGTFVCWRRDIDKGRKTGTVRMLPLAGICGRRFFKSLWYSTIEVVQTLVQAAVCPWPEHVYFGMASASGSVWMEVRQSGAGALPDKQCVPVLASRTLHRHRSAIMPAVACFCLREAPQAASKHAHGAVGAEVHGECICYGWVWVQDSVNGGDHPQL